jgi:tetratricopeptide (TPR) repeat protein
VFLSEQPTPHMAAAARVYGDVVLDAGQEASLDARATLGRRLLQEIFGIRDRNGPLPDAVQALIVDPEDPEARDALEGHVQGVLTDDPVLAAVVADTLIRFYRNEIDAGNIRAMRDLGDLLRGQDDLDGARAAYQRAADSGDPDVAPEALVDLGHLLMIFQRDYGGASAYFRQAISSAHPEWSAARLVSLALALVKHGDTAGAKDAYQHAIESGDNDTAARASVFLGELLQKQGDITGHGRIPARHRLPERCLGSSGPHRALARSRVNHRCLSPGPYDALVHRDHGRGAALPSGLATGAIP